MTATSKKKPFQIMIVEDQATMRFFAARVLQQAGFDTIEAENGAQALALFERFQPDFILMDVIMPVLDGFAACEAIRARPYGQHVPILMMTGTKNEQSIIRAYDAGATDFIGKPISRVALPHRVRYILRAKQTADRLRESEAQLANAQRIAKLGHWQYNSRTKTLVWSSEISRLFGLAPKSGSGDIDTWLSYAHADDCEYVRRILQNALHSQDTCRAEYRIVRADGTERIVYLETEAHYDADEHIQMLGTLQDITDRRWAETQIHQLVYYDGITGLPNRTCLLESLRNVLVQAKKTGQSVGIFFLDLDQFKLINDTLGHSSGDELLRQVAHRLQACIRAYDAVSPIGFADHRITGPDRSIENMIARLGGDEFVIIINDIRRNEDAAGIAQRLGDALAPAFQVEEHEIYVTASIGISIYPDDSKDLDSLLRLSDIAMYHAKRQGRDCYQFYEKSINAQIKKRLVVKNDLRRALDHQQLRLHYQPRLDIRTGQVVSVEALVRWQHPDHELILPNEFIPLAEESGLIMRLGEWVLRTACSQAKAWQDNGLADVSVSVNLSAIQFNRRGLADTLNDILQETALAPECLELELTESTVMESTENGISLLNSLKSIGLRIAIDDFGTGYSSLAYLKRFPIDVLKIDQSFIRDISSDNDSAVIVATTIDLAHNLSLKVIAEGVEQTHQLNFLRSRGCDEVQGFLLAKPMAFEELTEWFKTRHPVNGAGFDSGLAAASTARLTHGGA